MNLAVSLTTVTFCYDAVGHNPPNNGQFSTDRYAFLFKPGQYNVDVPIGYYTSVYGLGASPNDVNFTSPRGVHSEEGDYSIGGALSSFWRSAENFLNLSLIHI